MPISPLPWMVALSYSARTGIGVVLGSTTNSPPPRNVTKARRLVDVMTGTIGALSGRTSANWQGMPDGAVHDARSSVAAGSNEN